MIEHFDRGHVPTGLTTDKEVGYDPVADTAVSSRHNEESADGRDLFIRDLGPANGTLVDGVAVRKRARL